MPVCWAMTTRTIPTISVRAIVDILSRTVPRVMGALQNLNPDRSLDHVRPAVERAGWHVDVSASQSASTGHRTTRIGCGNLSHWRGDSSVPATTSQSPADLLVESAQKREIAWVTASGSYTPSKCVMGDRPWPRLALLFSAASLALSGIARAQAQPLQQPEPAASYGNVFRLPLIHIPDTPS